jgi:hypothetical protein
MQVQNVVKGICDHQENWGRKMLKECREENY